MSRNLDWARRTTVAAAVVALALVAVSLVIQKVPVTSVLGIPQQPATHLLDVRSEQNLHTWFNVAVLLLAAVACVLVGLLARTSGAAGWPWWVVGVVLAAMSVDDLTALHEGLEHLGRNLAGEDAPHFAWLVPGSIIAVALLTVVLVAAVRLPTRVRAMLGAGFFVFFGAAVGLEYVGGLLLTGLDDIRVYILVSHLEEALESLAAVLLLGVPLHAVHGERTPDGVLLRYRPAARGGHRRVGQAPNG